jgi:hypothetical protein
MREILKKKKLSIKKKIIRLIFAPKCGTSYTVIYAKQDLEVGFNEGRLWRQGRVQCLSLKRIIQQWKVRKKKMKEKFQESKLQFVEV